MKTKLLQAALVLSAFSGFSTQAAMIKADGNIYQNCSAVTLNYVGTPTTNSLQQSYNASSCKGMAGNDPDYALNVGLFGDGLLNGENGLFTSYEFAQWVDVNGDGTVDKPGWIGLARVEGEDDIKYNTVNGVDLHPYQTFGNIFDLTFGYTSGLSGTWNLQVNTAALLAAKSLLGNSYFDHLNIVLKGGTTGFMSYNFNFNQIFSQHNQAYNTNLALLNNYTLGGTWATSNLLKAKENCDWVGQGKDKVRVCTPTGEYIQQELSHATFAAHDPILKNDVSAPATVGLFGLSLLGLIANRRRKN